MSYVISNVSEGDMPSFEDVSQTWDPLDSDQGRIVVYALDPFQVRELMIPMPPSWRIQLDDTARTEIFQNTFAFADVSVGSHSVRFEESGRSTSRRQPGIEVRLKSLETVYVEVSSGELRVVPEEKARVELMNSKHRCRDTLPFNP